MLDYRVNTFLDLCKTLNYRKTAENLSMTQPGVTQHIHYLEHFYGCKLFLYDYHTLKMTSEGAKVKHYIENICYQEKKLFLSLQKPDTVYLKIGATKTVGEYVIGPHVAAFLATQGNRISIEVHNTETLLEKLRKGEFDFVIIEGAFDPLEFSSVLYRTESFIGLCNKNHPFAGRVVTPEELVAENLLIREEGSGTRKLLETLIQHKNLSLDMFAQVTTINNFGLISQLLEENTGVTFAYESVQSQNPMLASFQLAQTATSHDFVYVFLNNEEAKGTVQYFDSYRLG